jgi:mRNA interferase MazF
MRRGDLVTVAAPGSYGKPRPAVIVQTDLLDAHSSVLVALVTSTLVDSPLFRLSVHPDEANGLRTESQIMADRIMAVPREKVGGVIGRLGDEVMLRLNRAVAFVMGLG